MSTTEMLTEVYGPHTPQSDFAILNERLNSIESKVNEIYEIFCKLYQAYEEMSKSPMIASLMGSRLGK